MYSELTLEKYAEVLYWGLTVARGRDFKKSDLIMVRYDMDAAPLAEAVVTLLHEHGMVPVPKAAPTPRMERDLYTLANNKRLTATIPGERELLAGLAGSISLSAPASLNHLAAVDPERFARRQGARKHLSDIQQTRERLGEYSWTLGLYPTKALAEAAGMSLEDYAQALKEACMLGHGAPLRDWKLLIKRVRDTRDQLTGLKARAYRVQSDSMDLLVPAGERRRWIGLTGRNIPSYEVYTSPDWRGVEGTFYADLPSYRTGNVIRGVRLTITRGQVTELSAEEGTAFAVEQLKSDSGAARLGEFALVDRRFSPIDRFMANTLLDENHGGDHGSCHIALGNSYANTFTGHPPEFTDTLKKALGFNQSGLHWDLVNTEPKTVHALLPDGTRKLIYEDGEFRL